MRVGKILLALLAVTAALAIGGYRYWESRLVAPINVTEPTLYEVSGRCRLSSSRIGPGQSWHSRGSLGVSPADSPRSGVGSQPQGLASIGSSPV